MRTAFFLETFVGLNPTALPHNLILQDRAMDQLETQPWVHCSDRSAFLRWLAKFIELKKKSFEAFGEEPASQANTIWFACMFSKTLVSDSHVWIGPAR